MIMIIIIIIIIIFAFKRQLIENKCYRMYSFYSLLDVPNAGRGLSR